VCHLLIYTKIATVLSWLVLKTSKWQMSLHALCSCTQIASLEAVIGDEERRQAEATQKEQDMQAKLDELQQVCHVYTLA